MQTDWVQRKKNIFPASPSVGRQFMQNNFYDGWCCFGVPSKGFFNNLNVYSFDLNLNYLLNNTFNTFIKMSNNKTHYPFVKDFLPDYKAVLKVYRTQFDDSKAYTSNLQFDRSAAYNVNISFNKNK